MEIIKDVETEIQTNTNCVNHNGGNYDEATGGGMVCGGSAKD